MNARRARILLSLILAASLVFAVAGAAQAAVVVKATSSMTWSPKKTSIARGTKVIWQNPTGRDHTVSAYGGGWTKNTLISAGGGSTSFTFKSTGVYTFRCRFHSTLVNGVCSGMCGKIVVS